MESRLRPSSTLISSGTSSRNSSRLLAESVTVVGGEGLGFGRFHTVTSGGSVN